jgi:proline iminopeptidase
VGRTSKGTIVPTSRIDHGTVREGYVPVDGTRLYFRELGEGPPLLVLHGGPDFNHSYFLPEMDLMASAFRLIYYDQRGRGKSSAGVAPEDVSIESEVQDLDLVRRHFGLDRVAVLGHSWGGVLAMEYAARHPERVSHLILLNTGPASRVDALAFREGRRATEAEGLERMRAIAKTREYIAGDIDTEAEYYSIHFRRAVVPEYLERVVRSLRTHFTPEDIVKARAIEERLYEETWQRPGYDLIARLRTSPVPTLVIHGDRDFVPLEGNRHIADGVPGARLVQVKDCGHFSYLERPAEVLGAIVSHISGA